MSGFWIIVIIVIFTFTSIVTVISGASSLSILVTDAGTREMVADAQVYLDGRYLGVTSSEGVAGLPAGQVPGSGTHTVRVVKPGFGEITKTFLYPGEPVINITLQKTYLVSLNRNGTSPDGINVVFYPSSTSYNCIEKRKVPTSLYLSNESRFEEDVMKVIRGTYLNLSAVTDSSNPVPADLTGRFNFYYYFDPSSPSDAFEGCAGSIPQSYWNNVSFSDITVILYPMYGGFYEDTSCQPMGCFQHGGVGQNLMKIPSNQETLILHETGHAVFGLVDTYCGTTYYYENDPYANVWSSRDSCRADAALQDRDPAACRRIQITNSAGTPTCTKDFWHWDPSPDIMGEGYRGTFGAAATQRINYVLTQKGV